MVSEKNVVREGLLLFKSRCEKVLALALAAFVQIVYSSRVINFPSNCSMCVNSRHKRVVMCFRTVSRQP